ncbi:MAG: PT domain-containing protein [Clostridia bacterium]|nr:PT domain-containing protein [Clostridia bacterium]
MKRLIPIFLAALLVIPFAACVFTRPTVSADPTEAPTAAPTEAVTEAPTEAPTPAPTDTPEPTEAPTPAPAAEPEAMLRPGYIYGGCYENRTLGYGVMLGGWQYANETELAALNNALLVSSPREIQSILQDCGIYIDMYAEAPGGTQSVNIQYQSVKKLYGDIGLSVDDIVDLVIAALPETLHSIGVTEPKLEKGSVSFDDAEFPAIKLECIQNGSRVHQLQFYILRDEFLCVATLSSLEKSDLDGLLSRFYRLPGEYEWGTGFDEIFAAEVNDGMIENEDYFIRDGSYFISKELNVYSPEFGCWFVVRYNFDLDGGLVSVEKICAENMERDDEIELAFRLIDDAKALYGEPSREKNPYYEAQYGGYDQFVERICSGNISSSEITWTIENGDSYMIGLEPDTDRLLLVVCRYSKDAR